MDRSSHTPTYDLNNYKRLKHRLDTRYDDNAFKLKIFSFTEGYTNTRAEIVARKRVLFDIQRRYKIRVNNNAADISGIANSSKIARTIYIEL